jgi:hypothetical protein
LLVYLIALGLFALHDLGLTVAAVITHAASRPALLVYAISNMVLVTYTLVLYVLMMGKRESAVANNVIMCCRSCSSCGGTYWVRDPLWAHWSTRCLASSVRGTSWHPREWATPSSGRELAWRAAMHLTATAQDST